MDVGAPAVVAAIADATGAWVRELPATPERIMAQRAAAETAS
jgi:CO/xanthine dehydrogenase Mo-binding subunit